MKFAQGKLLITGEYLILDGAKALAFPLKYGQSLECSPQKEDALLHWQSFEMENVWLDAKIDKQSLTLFEANDLDRAEGLIKVLQEAKNLKQGDFILSDHIQMKSNFPFVSGFGSSATLIALIANLFQVDIFELSDATFGGSGYDVACAFHEGPLTYELKEGKRTITPVALSPEVTQHLFFIHSGQKMNSRNAITHYRSQDNSTIQEAVKQMNGLTEAFLNADSKETLETICTDSEALLKKILNQDTWNDQFPDCPFALKALGAWGGDYFMAIASNKEEVADYFKTHQLNQILCYQELI